MALMDGNHHDRTAPRNHDEIPGSFRCPPAFPQPVARLEIPGGFTGWPGFDRDDPVRKQHDDIIKDRKHCFSRSMITDHQDNHLNKTF